MCGGSSNYRTPSLFVGWLNVVLSVLVVFYYTYLLVTFEQKRVENSESEESVESDLQPIFGNSVKQNYVILAYIAATVLLSLVPSILMVKGIKQNRRKLVAPWLYLAYVSVAVNFVYLVFTIWFSAGFTGSLGASLISCLPFALALIIWCLCIYPVGKLYKIMSIPPPILPTQNVMVATKAEDQEHCMPVFDN